MPGGLVSLASRPKTSNASAQAFETSVGSPGSDATPSMKVERGVALSGPLGQQETLQLHPLLLARLPFPQEDKKKRSSLTISQRICMDECT